MKEVNTRVELIELLKDILNIEKKARDNYESDIITFQNFIITDTIQKIKNDEDRHIDMIEELLEMLKKK